jgi:nucleotidyltransferase AbiEii toxin of type IV toxin-antitoxin system
MELDKLTPLQRKLLGLLAGMTPTWTLTGGAALVGVYLKHRETRDLDLFWHGRATLDLLAAQVIERTRNEGLEVSSIQSEPSFSRLRVTDGSSVVLLDLVADPTPVVEPPVQVSFGSATITVDTLHEILVNKLCAILGRSELRDLQDIEAILAAKGDLERALRDAPQKDSGFSPLTLAWILRGLPVRSLSGTLGWDAQYTDRIEKFRDDLVQRVLQAARPEA